MQSQSARCQLIYFFFFQAEDGIRDLYVTGVQTCALPILRNRPGHAATPIARADFSALAITKSAACCAFDAAANTAREIGRASCRERVYISWVGVSFSKIMSQTSFRVSMYCV